MTIRTLTSAATLAALASAGLPAQEAETPAEPRGLDAFHTYSQRAWGDPCVDADAPACWLEQHFATLFPSGVVLGDLDGDDGDTDGEHALVFDSADAVAAFLPIAADRPLGTLSRTVRDPTPDGIGLGGALAGELLAAELNVAFDARGLMPTTMGGTSLVELVFVDGVADPLVGRTVADVIALGHALLAGRDGLGFDDRAAAVPSLDLDGDGEPDASPRDVHAALAAFNGNFAQGALDAGRLAPPIRPLKDDAQTDGGR